MQNNNNNNNNNNRSQPSLMIQVKQASCSSSCQWLCKSPSTALSPLHCSDDECLGFVWVELQTVLHILLSDVSGRHSKNRQSGSCVVGAHCKMKLSVVSILVILYSVICDNVGHWAAADSEQYRSKYQTLRHSDCQL